MTKTINKEKSLNTIFHNNNNTIKRPWGYYTVLSEGKGFKVKLVEVLPNKRLSLQKHKHRSEHWVVIKGEAKITNDSGVYILKCNESTFIPQQGIHRLENYRSIPLQLIEIQSGKYLGEDDIERLEDDFGRR